MRRLGPLVMALMATTAFAIPPSDSNLRNRASTFGMTPRQAVEIFAQMDRLRNQIDDIATRRAVPRPVLQAALLKAGRRNPTISDTKYLELARAKADEAAAAVNQVAALRTTIAKLDPGALKSTAARLLDQAEAAFDGGQLEEAQAAFVKIEALRLSDVRNGNEAWVAAVTVRARVTLLVDTITVSSAVYHQAAVEAEAAGRRTAWELEYRNAHQWFEHAQLYGDPRALAQARTIFERDVLPRALRQTLPKDWARTQLGLAATLALEGQWNSQPDRLDQAARAYGLALEILTPEDDFDDWAIAQGAAGSLAISRWERTKARQPLERAVTQMRAAIARGGPALKGEAGVALHTNLAIALEELGTSPLDATLLAEATKHYDAAIAVAKRDASTNAMRQQIELNRCNLLIKLGGLLGTTVAFDEAVTGCQAARDAISANEAPFLRAAANINLSAAMLERGKRTLSRSDLLATQALVTQARAQVSPADHPREWMRATLILASSQLGLGSMAGDTVYFTQARANLDLAQAMLAQMVDPELRSWHADLKAILSQMHSN